MFVLRLLLNLAIFCVPAIVAGFVAWKLAAKSYEEWKALAWVPVLPVAAWGPFIAWGVTRDPTSHNLWPFELVMVGGLSLVLLALFLMGRWSLRREPKDPWARRPNNAT